MPREGEPGDDWRANDSDNPMESNLWGEFSRLPRNILPGMRRLALDANNLSISSADRLDWADECADQRPDHYQETQNRQDESAESSGAGGVDGELQISRGKRVSSIESGVAGPISENQS